jgi:hypothetical protein
MGSPELEFVKSLSALAEKHQLTDWPGVMAAMEAASGCLSEDNRQELGQWFQEQLEEGARLEFASREGLEAMKELDGLMRTHGAERVDDLPEGARQSIEERLRMAEALGADIKIEDGEITMPVRQPPFEYWPVEPAKDDLGSEKWVPYEELVENQDHQRGYVDAALYELAKWTERPLQILHLPVIHDALGGIVWEIDALLSKAGSQRANGDSTEEGD